MKNEDESGRYFFLVIMYIIIVCFFVTNVYPEQIRLMYTFDEPTINISNEKSSLDSINSKISQVPYAYIKLPKTIQHAENIGDPILPMKTAKILIPANHTISSVKVVSGKGQQIKGLYNIGFRKLEQITSSKKPLITNPNKQIYESASRYPGKFYEHIGIQKKSGTDILILKLFPVQYIPNEGKLLWYDKLDVIVETEPDESRNEKESEPLTSIAATSQFVDNPYDIISYPNVFVNENKFLDLLEFPYITYNYVIISDDKFAREFQVLVDHKKLKGISARVVTTSWIYSNFSGVRPDGGTDNQTKIRTFISYAKSNWFTEYILLGGDDEIIPHRGCRGKVNIYEDDDIPTDLYYACLDGTWDHDADGIYGELNDGISGGEIDLLSDVFVGRAPVDNVNEVNNFVNKTIEFEKSKFDKNGLMTGTQLDSVTWGGDHKDLVAGIFPGSWSINTLYDRDGTATKASVINEINYGNHMVLNSAGHGNSGGFSHLNRVDVDGLSNQIRPLIYTWACYTASFDNRLPNATYESDDCIAEHFIENTNGAFAYIGNSRFGFYSSGSTNGSSQQYDETFFETLFNDNITNLGKTLADSKEDLIGSVAAQGSYRWIYFCLNLLGDPETQFSADPICYEKLPKPDLQLIGTENYTVRGNEFIRYRLTVNNWNKYPNDIFAQAPYLPPCGLNANSSRTWVHIYNSNGTRLYGFCALNTSDDLTKLWYAIPKNATPPDSVYIVIEDRACDVKYTSKSIVVNTTAQLPSFNYTYSNAGQTRGFWFVAPTDLVLTGVQVPDESGNGKQNVEIVRFNQGIAPPEYSSTTNAFTSLYRNIGTPSSNKLNVHIPISAGETIGIIGAAGNSTRMYNSYGNGTYTSSFFGNAVVFKRLGMQYNLAITQCKDLWTGSGYIGRVKLWYTK